MNSANGSSCVVIYRIHAISFSSRRFRIRSSAQVDWVAEKHNIRKPSSTILSPEWYPFLRAIRSKSPDKNPVSVVSHAISVMYSPLSSFKTRRGSRIRVTFPTKRYRGSKLLRSVDAILSPNPSVLRQKQKIILRKL